MDGIISVGLREPLPSLLLLNTDIVSPIKKWKSRKTNNSRKENFSHMGPGPNHSTVRTRVNPSKSQGNKLLVNQIHVIQPTLSTMYQAPKYSGPPPHPDMLT